MKRIIVLCLLFLAALTVRAQEFVDLGLPSGTMWKDANEKAILSYQSADKAFTTELPTKGQWEELIEQCKWEWTDGVYHIIGPNGNEIVLPAEGYFECNASFEKSDNGGHYWSSTHMGSGRVWSLDFNEKQIGMEYGFDCYKYSVRLVRKKAE